MTQSRTVLETKFNPFLYSRLWVERDDMTLSVLSALARLDVDPWGEAADLAQLPRESAYARLAAMRRRLAGTATCGDIEFLSRRSVDLLPAIEPDGHVWSSDTTAGDAKAPAKGWRPIRFVILAGWLLALSLMAGQLLARPGVAAKAPPHLEAPARALGDGAPLTEHAGG